MQSLEDLWWYRIRYMRRWTVLQAMRKSANGWRIEDLQAVAGKNFVECRRPRGGGSHVIFSASGVREVLSVPAKRPIKPGYVKQFVALIDAVRAIGAEWDAEDESKS